MPRSMISLLGKLSSINVRKVAWTCDELGLPFVREDWGSGFRDTHVSDYVALNPNALVPVIRDGDFVLWESNTIIRYLANRYGAHLYPTEPMARARVDQWLDWQATNLNTAWRYAFPALARNSPDNDPVRVAESVKAWNDAIGILDGQLTRTGSHVAGDVFSLADIAIGLSVHRWLKTPMVHSEWPAAMAYYERLKQRPAFLPYALDSVP